MPIINVQPDGKPVAETIPNRGYYVTLKYVFGDGDGYENVTAGPFPEREKSLLIEFLNVLDAMLDKYPHGKGGYDDYDDVPGYIDFFEPHLLTVVNAGQTFRTSLGLQTVYVPDDSGCVAELTDYESYFRNGHDLSKQIMTPVYSEQKGD